MKLIDKILTEWAYRVHDGMPDPTNPLHLINLRESLEHLKIDTNYINTIMEKMYVRNKTSGNVYDIEKKSFNADRHEKIKKSDYEKLKKSGDVSVQDTSTPAGKKQRETDEFVSDVLDELLGNLSKGRQGGIAGEFGFESLEDLKVMQDFYKREGKNLHKKKQDILFPNISQKQFDAVWDALQQKGKEMHGNSNYLTDKIVNKGAPPDKYKTPERAKKVLMHYLQTGGVSIVTGKRVPFTRMQLDHAVSLGNGGKDDPSNWHWMEARYNQQKGALATWHEDAEKRELLNKLKNIEKSGATGIKLKQLEDSITNMMKNGLYDYFLERFEAGDDCGLTEDSLHEYDKTTLDRIALALNNSQGWGEGALSIKRYGQVTDKNPDSPTYGEALTRRDPKTGMRKVKPPKPTSTKKNLEIYKKLERGEKLTAEEQKKIDRDLSTWGVDYDPNTGKGSKPKFADTVTYKGKKMKATTLIKWKNPKGKVVEVPVGYALTYEYNDERESGGASLAKEDLIDNIKDGFARAKYKGKSMKLLTKEEEAAINNPIEEKINEFKRDQDEMKSLKKQYAAAETKEEKEAIKKKIDTLYDKTKDYSSKELLKKRHE